MKSLIKIFTRRLRRNRAFSLLNIAGLAVGMAIGLLIFQMVRYELSIDTFHRNRDRIYRVVSMETYRNGVIDYDGDAPMPLADALRKEFPQAEKVAATWKEYGREFTIVGAAEKRFRPDGVFYVDPALFDIFDFPWIAGDPHTALQEPYTMAITRSVADSWFGHWPDAMGRTVTTAEGHDVYKITGIMADPPLNTDISMQVVLSYATMRLTKHEQLADPKNWDNFSGNSQCFFLLPKGQRIGSMEAMLPAFVARHYTPLWANSDTRDSSYFQPLKEMHFNTVFYRYGKDGWSYKELWAIGLIGIFILAMACINFINLSTAQSLNRGKEVGVRKVLGSNPRQLFLGFLAETGLLVVLAMVLGFALACVSEPALAQLLQKPLSVYGLLSGPTLLFLVGAGILVTVMAGSYPGLVLSRFEPIAAIKSKINSNSAGGLSLRRGLIVLQFVFAQLLIICTLVVARQMNFFRTRPMGFDRKAIAVISLPQNKESVQKNALFKSQVMHIPGVVSASLCSDPPSSGESGTTLFTFENHPHPEDFEVAYRFADSDYLSTFHIRLAAGRYPYPSDTVREVMLNETTARRLGFASPPDIVGRFLRWGDLSRPAVTVVGVVRDSHASSLKEKITPLLMFTAARNYNHLAVKLNPAATGNALAQMQTLFSREYPGHFFDAPFFDDAIASYYNAEAIASTLFRIFAGLAIFISCLGLYGLVSFMAIQKTKEVGIRKVLGASIGNIVYIFSREFTVLIGIAFLLAAPLGYYFMHKWLVGFYYHIDVGWGIFATAIALSVLIAWITVGYRAVRAAVADPVKSLRSE